MEIKFYALYNGRSRLGHWVTSQKNPAKGPVYRHYKFTAEQAASYLRINPKARVRETSSGDLFNEKE